MSDTKKSFKDYIEIIDSNFARQPRDWGAAAPAIAENREFLNNFLVDVIDCVNDCMPGRNLKIMETLNQSVDHAGCELSCVMGIHAQIARTQPTETDRKTLLAQCNEHVTAVEKLMKKARTAWGEIKEIELGATQSR